MTILAGIVALVLGVFLERRQCTVGSLSTIDSCESMGKGE